jgi:hypothetical protein
MVGRSCGGLVLVDRAAAQSGGESAWSAVGIGLTRGKIAWIAGDDGRNRGSHR